jgi:very-short-patch-repair endonuclease
MGEGATNTGDEGERVTNTGNQGERDWSWRLSQPMVYKPANTDRLIVVFAAKQHGVISTAQLEAAGLTRAAIAKRVKAARLHRLHRGVYAVGHTRLTFEGRCMAAMLALGEGAAISHRSAAALWGLLPPDDGPIEITVPGDGGRERRKGIRVHRSSTFIAGVSILRNGIAVTKATRTLRDLHRTVSQSVYRTAVRRALDKRLISSAQLRSEEELTRSELEKLMLRLCRRHRLPQPEVNARVGPHEVDFLWRDQKVIVETDPWRHHGDRSAFERDRARDAHLQSLGFRVLRFTHRQLTHQRSTVVAVLRDFLGQRSLTPNL